jgi:hypothetical protein
VSGALSERAPHLSMKKHPQKSKISAGLHESFALVNIVKNAADAQ